MEGGWEGDFEPPPAFAVFFVRRGLLATYAFLREQERHGHVIVECVTGEIEEPLCRPGRLALMAFKGFTRLVEHGCLHARIALDRHTAIAEDAAAAGQRKT